MALSPEEKSAGAGRLFLMRLLPALGVLILLAVIIGPGMITSWFTGDSRRLATRVKLQNLKATMGVITQLAANGEILFPPDEQAVLEFMTKDSGEPFYDMRNRGRNPFQDGWGGAMRFQGDINGYEIRSAGPDRVFENEDDIYLIGDVYGDSIIDESQVQRLTREDFLQPADKRPFREPHGYYELHLPGRFTVIRSSTGSRSEITFSYAKDMKVAITAGPVSPAGGAEAAMLKRVEVLRREEDEMMRDFSIIQYGLMQIGDSRGYEITLEKEQVLVREMSLISPSSLGVSITIVTNGSDRAHILDLLVAAVHRTLFIS